MSVSAVSSRSAQVLSLVPNDDQYAQDVAVVFGLIRDAPVDALAVHRAHATVFSPHTLARFFIALKEHIVEQATLRGHDGTAVWHYAVPPALNATEPGRIETLRSVHFLDERGVWDLYVAFAHNQCYGVAEIDPLAAQTILEALGVALSPVAVAADGT